MTTERTSGARSGAPNFVTELLTIKEAAGMLRISEKTVRRWIEGHELPAAKLGAQWRIRPRDLDLFIKDRLEW
jgi:excisionase family DNA binding protein